MRRPYVLPAAISLIAIGGGVAGFYRTGDPMMIPFGIIIGIVLAGLSILGTTKPRVGLRKPFLLAAAISLIAIGGGVAGFYRTGDPMMIPFGVIIGLALAGLSILLMSRRGVAQGRR